jgi:hypothetical protein
VCCVVLTQHLVTHTFTVTATASTLCRSALSRKASPAQHTDPKQQRQTPGSAGADARSGLRLQEGLALTSACPLASLLLLPWPLAGLTPPRPASICQVLQHTASST